MQYQQSWRVNDLLAQSGSGAITNFAFGSAGAPGTLVIANLAIDFSVSENDLGSDPTANIGGRDTLVYNGLYSSAIGGNQGDIIFALVAPYQYTAADAGKFLVANFQIDSPAWSSPGGLRADIGFGSREFFGFVDTTTLQTDFTVTPASASPEPSTGLLVGGLGLAVLFAGKHRLAR